MIACDWKPDRHVSRFLNRLQQGIAYCQSPAEVPSSILAELQGGLLHTKGVLGNISGFFKTTKPDRWDCTQGDWFAMSSKLVSSPRHCPRRIQSQDPVAPDPLQTPANATDAKRAGLRLVARASCNAKCQLITSLSTDLSTTGSNSESLLGSRICAGTSSRVIASFCVVSRSQQAFTMAMPETYHTNLTSSNSASFATYSRMTSPVPKSTYTRVSRILNSTLSNRMKNRHSNNNLAGMTRILHDSIVMPLSASSSSYKTSSSKKSIGSGRFRRSKGMGAVEVSKAGPLEHRLPL